MSSLSDSSIQGLPTRWDWP